MFTSLAANNLWTEVMEILHSWYMVMYEGYILYHKNTYFEEKVAFVSQRIMFIRVKYNLHE